MSKVSPTTLKTYFERGDQPTEAQFVDLIDSTVNKVASLSSYGATGNGATDDTSAIELALENESILEADPDGIYIIDSLDYDGAGEEKIIIGNGATFKLKDQTSNIAATFKKFDRLILSDLNFDGNKSNQSTNASNTLVLFDRVKDLILGRSTFHDSIYHGAWIFKCRKALISHCEFYSNGVGDSNFPADGLLLLAGNAVVESNRFYLNNTNAGGGDDIDGDGVQITTGGSDSTGFWDASEDLKRHITLIDNECYSNGRRGIKIQRDNVSCKDNVCYNNRNDILVAQSTQNLKNINIEGNTTGQEGLTSNGAVLISMGGGFSVSNFNCIDNKNFSDIDSNDAFRFEDVDGFLVSNNQNYGSIMTGVYNDISIRGSATNGDVEYIDGDTILKSGTNINYTTIKNQSDSYDKLFSLSYQQSEWGKRYELQHNTLTSLFDVSLPDRSGYGLIIDYNTIDVDGNGLPTSSAIKYASAGTARISVNSDSSGNLASDIVNDKSDSGDSATTVTFSVSRKDSTTSTVELTVSNGSSRNVMVSMSIRLLRYNYDGSFGSSITFPY